MPGSIKQVKRYYRSSLKANPQHLFVFGDNYVKRGLGGQAKECRGEPNAVGIPTKWAPAMKESAFFKDTDFDRVKGQIDEGYDRLEEHLRKGGMIIWPADGIGTYLARLEEKAPSIYQYLLDRYANLRKICDE